MAGESGEAQSGVGSVMGSMDAAMTRRPQVLYKMMHDAGQVTRTQGTKSGTVVVAQPSARGSGAAPPRTVFERR